MICAAEKCTGCAACVNACSKACIEMREDDLGALHPVVDETRCVHCDACRRACPNNAQVNFYRPLVCYAAWLKDSKDRMHCATGGIGTMLSRCIVDKGGVVFGSSYDADLTPRMQYTNTQEGLERFKGSRYVQSIVSGNTFVKVREFLEEKKQVLFIGTPCQIAGLKTYLHRDYDNLITADLICHGTVPTRYFKEEIVHLSDKLKLEGISDVRFRGNDPGSNYALTIWNKNGKRIYRGTPRRNYYLLGFLRSVTLRENCFSCNYARPERISDITIGDFIGLGKRVPFRGIRENISVVLVNTEKGAALYSQICSDDSRLASVKRDYEERLLYRPSLLEPSRYNRARKNFVSLYSSHGYRVAVRKSLWLDMQMSRIIWLLHLPLAVAKRVIRILSR